MAAHALAVGDGIVLPEPTALARDSASGTLCVADSTGGITRGGALLATLGEALGALALDGDGGVIVTCGLGTIARVGRDGTLTAYPLDDQRRRGVIIAGGVLYATQHEMSKFGAHDGSIIALDPHDVTRAPSTVIDGFHEPIGLAAVGPSSSSSMRARAR